ncbi:MAG TPA: zf-HC2 domain-containing protein, partial [Gemmatimonadaceae bacterium]
VSMRDCVNGEVRDRLPDLLHGQLPMADRAAVLAHVSACAECTAELALLRELRGAMAVAPAVDVSRIVAAVRRHPDRGRNVADEGPGVAAERPDSRIVPIDTARRRREARPRAWGGRWRVAAAIATLMVGGTSVGILARQRGSADPAPVASRPGGAAGAAATPAPGVVSSPTVATADPAPAAPVQVASRAGDVDQVGGGLLADATDAELQALIDEIEQFDGTPVVEPEPVSPVVGVNGTSGGA